MRQAVVRSMGAVLGLGLLMLPGSGAAALTCGSPDPGDGQRVVTGAIEARPEWVGHLVGTVATVDAIKGDYDTFGASITLDVAATFGMDLGRRVTIKDLPSGVSGVGFRDGERYFVTLLRNRNGLFTQLCSVTYAVDDAEYAQLVRLGGGLPPTDGPVRDAPGSPDPLLLSVVAGLAGLLWVARQRAQKSETNPAHREPTPPSRLT